MSLAYSKINDSESKLMHDKYILHVEKDNYGLSNNLTYILNEANTIQTVTSNDYVILELTKHGEAYAKKTITEFSYRLVSVDYLTNQALHL